MPGMINAPQTAQPAAQAPATPPTDTAGAAPAANSNPALEQIETQIETKAKDPAVLNRIVAAGMKVMFSEQTHNQAMEQVESAGDPIKGAAEGIVMLMGILMKESRNTMPADDAMLAAVILLCRLLDFMEKRGMVQLTDESIGQAVQMMFSHMMEKAGIDDAAIGKLTSGLGGAMQQDPSIMQKVQGGQ